MRPGATLAENMVVRMRGAKNAGRWGSKNMGHSMEKEVLFPGFKVNRLMNINLPQNEMQ
jgi:hypothetical protein